MYFKLKWEKKDLRKRKRKKNSCLELSQFQFLDMCASVFYFCALIVINGLLYKKRHSECFSFTQLLLKKTNKYKVNCLKQRNRRLSRPWLWWHFCTLTKKKELLCLLISFIRFSNENRNTSPCSVEPPIVTFVSADPEADRGSPPRAVLCVL